MKIAIVVQRYGNEVCGGAEVLARYLAERLVNYFSIEVITTTARDYSSWKPHYREGKEDISSVPVHRFHAHHPRKRIFCGVLWRLLTHAPHPEFLERVWLKANGPYSPGLLKFIQDNSDTYDLFIFITYFFATTFLGLPPVHKKAVLIPTAHDEPLIRFAVFRNFFRLPSAIFCLTEEERTLVSRIAGLDGISAEITGMGVNVPQHTDQEAAFKAIPELKGKEYILYIGRISSGKGSATLIDFFSRYLEKTGRDTCLVMVGSMDQVKKPAHRHIILPGFVTEEVKFSLIRNARLLVNPSYVESFSLILLEAWLMEIPVMVNEKCAVLNGQISRSGGGLTFSDYQSFSQNLTRLLDDRELSRKMALSGREYALANYSWEVVERKFTTYLKNLAQQR